MTTTASLRILLLSAVMLVPAACEAPAQQATAVPRGTTAPAARPWSATGPAQTIAAVAETELQEAAAVSQLHSIEAQDAKVFSISGGDPAVNGLVTYLGLYISSAEGWRVYPIGDFAEWQVAEITDQRVILSARQDTATSEGTIQSRDLRVRVDFTWVDEMPAPSITVTKGR